MRRCTLVWDCVDSMCTVYEIFPMCFTPQASVKIDMYVVCGEEKKICALHALMWSWTSEDGCECVHLSPVFFFLAHAESMGAWHRWTVEPRCLGVHLEEQEQNLKLGKDDKHYFFNHARKLSFIQVLQETKSMSSIRLMWCWAKDCFTLRLKVSIFFCIILK